jgi:hypothetical protein
VASGILAVFVESTLIPQAFWSENLTVCLMSAVLFVGLHLLQNAQVSERRFRLLTILFGLLLAGLVVTRLVPIVILPGVIPLLRARLSRQRVLHFALLASAVVLAVALAAMSANLYRYGRFELSNSVGRHLWNVVSPQADRMLADSPEYRSLRKAIPDAQGREWWELDEPDYGPDLAHFTREELMRKMALHGISRHPLLFVKLGAVNFATLLRRCPARLGLHHAAVNPLNRDSMLPPILGTFPLFERTLAGLHRFMAWIYRVLVYGVLLAGAVAFLFSRKAALSGTLLFFAYVFLTGLYVSGQIEEPDGRYVLLYFPALALLASTSAAMLVDLARSARFRE